MSSGSPSIQAAEAGRGEQVVELHRQLEALLGGIEAFEIHDADFVEAGRSGCARMSAAMSRSLPSRQARSRMFESRMCSRLWSGSASMPRRPSRPEAAALIRLRAALRRRRASLAGGASNERRTVSGRPALLPGV